MVVLLDEEEVTRCWKLIFEKDCHSDSIIELCDQSSKKKVIDIPYSEILSLDDEFANYLLFSPDSVISAGERLLKERINSVKTPHIRITGIPKDCACTFDDITNCENVRFRSIKGTLIKASSKTNGAFCSKISGGLYGEIISDLDVNSKRMCVHLRGDDNNDAFGNVLIFNGYWKSDSDNHCDHQSCQEGFFEVNSIESPDNIYGISFSKRDIEEIKQASEDHDFFDDLVRSIAPTIVGMEDVKTTLALQLFGGVRKNVEDGKHLLGNINILLLNDPETGVYSLIKSMSRLSPKGMLLSGDIKSSGIPFSGKGSESRTDDSDFSIDAGAVTITNNGLLCLEDLGSMIDRQSSINSVINEGIDDFCYSGGRIRLPSDTSLLCMVRPKFGRIVDGKDIAEQIDIHRYLTGLFDLVIPIRDVPQEGHDKLIADSILKKHIYANMMVEGANKGEIAIDNSDVPENTYSEDFIRRYVAYARLNCNPVLDTKIAELLKDEYLSLRKKYDCVTAHHLESMIRFAEASARMRLSNTVEIIDVMRGSMIINNNIFKIMAIEGYQDRLC